MKARIEASTDIGKIGAWDARRNDSALAGEWGKKFDQIVKEDCSAGNLFVIYTGGDGGGPIDVYVDVAVPEAMRKKFRDGKREFLLSLPSGRLLVGGLEDYRSGPARITGQDSIVEVPVGNYALRCLLPKGEVGFEQPTRAELDRAIGVKEHRYYRRVQGMAVAAYFAVPLLYLVLAVMLDWKRALAAAAALGTISFIAVAVLSRTERCRRAARIHNELWKQAYQRGLPTFIFELRRVDDIGALSGGSLRLDEAK